MTDLIERDYLIEKFEDTGQPALSEMGKGYDLGIKAALRVVKKTPAVNRWISCSEMMPDNGVAVLVYTGENNFKVWLAEYSKYMEVWTLAGNYIPIKKNAVTHWMPMPEPPESGAQDEAQP